MNYLRDLFRFRTWSLIGVVLFFFGQKMADVWYEPKTESKHNPFSFDECIGLMIDTVQVCILSLFEWLLVHHFVCSPTPDNPQNNNKHHKQILQMHLSRKAYGHELVNVRIQSAAMRHMMHVLE
jgi:hypothetical protein